MSRMQLDKDIKPLSEFRANAAALIDQVRETKRPLVLTQRGHTSVVVLGVSEYEHLMDEIELLRDVQRAEQQLSEGLGVEHEDAKAQLLAAARQ